MASCTEVILNSFEEADSEMDSVHLSEEDSDFERDVEEATRQSLMCAEDDGSCCNSKSNEVSSIYVGGVVTASIHFDRLAASYTVSPAPTCILANLYQCVPATLYCACAYILSRNFEWVVLIHYLGSSMKTVA